VVVRNTGVLPVLHEYDERVGWRSTRRDRVLVSHCFLDERIGQIQQAGDVVACMAPSGRGSAIQFPISTVSFAFEALVRDLYRPHPFDRADRPLGILPLQEVEHAGEVICTMEARGEI
jgi:hypothetical protein